MMAGAVFRSRGWAKFRPHPLPLFLLINLVIDLIVAFVDPRIRLGARTQ